MGGRKTPEGLLVTDPLDIANQNEDDDGKGLKRDSIAKLSAETEDNETDKGIKLAVCVMNGQSISLFALRGPAGFKVFNEDAAVSAEATRDLHSGLNDKWIGYRIPRKDLPTPFTQTDTKLKLKPALPVGQELEWVVAYDNDSDDSTSQYLKDAHVTGTSHLAKHPHAPSVKSSKAAAKKIENKKTLAGRRSRRRPTK